MVRLATAPDPVLQQIVEAVTHVARPLLVLLFGSRATGEAREDSDYDLMIVFANDADIEREETACKKALRDAGLSADVLTRTVSEYRRQQHDAGHLAWLVAREGRVLFTTGAIAQRDAAARVREHSEGVALWRKRAAADLRVARLTAEAPDPVLDAIGFHAHAAVEKLLKAEIAAQGTFPPRTHDLRKLLARVPSSPRDNVRLRAACALLQELYPLSRYPEKRMPTLEEARQALDAAVAATQYIMRD
jgi:HEPN domain-containing protein/predicted nucleotidyltransferase